MALGYPAARAIGKIAASTEHPLVQRLWRSENPWLQAGVLRGLAEANTPDLTPWLREAQAPSQPALVRSEAEIQLHRRPQR
jgi:hypothetical protein